MLLNPKDGCFILGTMMTPPIHFSLKPTLEPFPNSPCGDLRDCLSNNNPDCSAFSLAVQENDQLIWDEVQLTAEEVDDFFRSLDHVQHPAPIATKSKKGPWSSNDIYIMCSEVTKASGNIEDRCHKVWQEIASLVGRKKEVCFERYQRYIKEKKIEPKNSQTIKKVYKEALTQQDVLACKKAIKKFKLVREDGLLDIKRLSEHVNRAYSSLRYNIYQACDSVFCQDPFFATFRTRYRKIHGISFQSSAT